MPVEREERSELEQATGVRSIPVLVADESVIAGEEEILAYLDTHYIEPAQAREQREKAARAKRKELEHACLELTSVTP